MIWPINVIAETYGPNGRKIRMDRIVDAFGDVEAGMLKALQARRDRGFSFLGCEVTAITPLGQRIVRLVDTDDNGQLCLWAV